MTDNDFIHQFRQCSLPAEEFTHEAHCRAAVIYFYELGFEQGVAQLAKDIERYASALGARDKYHATLTYGMFRLVVEKIYPETSRQWSVVKVLLDDLIENGKQHIGQYYSDFVLASTAAKQSVVMPDVKPFESLSMIDDRPYELVPGSKPIIISMPHNGTCLAPDMIERLTPEGLARVDTDWYLRQLFHFAIEQGCYVIAPQFSRYVIDLNRDPDGVSLYPGADTTELCPTTTFAHQPIYKTGCEWTEQDEQFRLVNYWQPYHQQLAESIAEIKREFGSVLLFEAHSIASRVPRFFEGTLTDLNFGTNDGKSCNRELYKLISDFDTKQYSKVIDGRFKGGFITRHYADPAAQINTVQLEISQACYMDESSLTYDNRKAEELQHTLSHLIDSFSD
ncbi:MAG: N-formylglutamate deformylase, partial [Kangiellaceae bacterium]|nr:N-formylglutamate deformylase [Kangiellaceae bacterium]